MKRRLNWDVIVDNVREAREELENLEKVIAAGGKGRHEIALQISLQHAFHHLNFAWNVRRKSTQRYRKMTQRDFVAWGKHPRDMAR